MNVFLVTCFTSIIYSLLVQICLATHRCPPYSVNFAAYGLPECEPSFTATSKHDFEMLMKKLKCIGFGKWQVPAAKGCSSPADLPTAMRVEYPCQCHLGGKCRLRCHDNYELVGREFMECSPITSTYSIDATCMKMNCIDPILPENVQKVEGKCDLTGDCELRCVSDVLRMKGSNIIRCNNRIWSAVPVCIVLCKFAAIRSDLKRQEQCTGEQEEMCPVECLDATLALNGPINIVCQATGQWSKMPECGCNTDSLPRGVFLLGACAMAAGTQCSARCTMAYERDVSSGHKITCGVDGKWQTAQSIKCLRVCVVPPTLHPNTVLGGTCERIVEGSGCPVVCKDSNMHLVGSAEVTCLATGLYSTSPHCALPDKCPSDQFHGMDVGNCDFSFGTTCTVTCKDLLHKLVGETTMTCKVSGQWDQVPKCKKICVVPSPDASRSTLACGNLGGETCSFKCADNYSPSEPIVITCLESGQWSSVPECVKMCPELVLPSDMVKASECSSLPNTECGLICRESEYLTWPDSKVRCQESSQWTVLPKCKKKCTPTPLNIVDLEISGECHKVEGNKCPAKCTDRNQVIVGSGFLLCTNEGWTRGDTECSSRCGLPPLDEQEDEMYIYEGICELDKAFSTCILMCANRMATNRFGVATCEYGKWSIKINCDNTCGPIQLRPGSHASGWEECDLYEGSSCPIKCNKPNFFMDGKSKVTIYCRDKKWTVPPLCEIQCDALALPPQLKLKKPCDLKNNTVCQVQCVDAEAAMEGDPNFLCQAPVWNGVMPSCSKFCLPPSGVSFQFDGTCSMRENVACRVKCSAGVRAGPDKVTCLETRSWSQFPECRTTCPEIQPPLTPLTTCEISGGAICLLACKDPGRRFSETLGPTRLYMQCTPRTMSWNPPDVRCIPEMKCAYNNSGRLLTRLECYNGMDCRLFCTAPYYITKRITLRCEAGKLDLSPLPADPLSLCEIATYQDCSNLQEQIGSGLRVENSSISSLKYGQKTDVKCTKQGEYVIGTKWIMCQLSGKLGTLPQCAVVCSLPGGKLGGLEVFRRACRNIEGQYCGFQCPDDKIPEGDSVMAECGMDGDWLNAPKCRPKVSVRALCPSLPSEFGLKWKEGKYWRLQCWNPFKDTTGPFLVYCLPEGRWTKLPKCESWTTERWSVCMEPNMIDWGSDSKECDSEETYPEGYDCTIKTSREECVRKGIKTVKTYCLKSGAWSLPVC